MDFGYLFTSTEGRINRAKWWVGMIVLAVVNIVLSWVLLSILGTHAPIALLVLQLVLFYPGYAVGAKRFQDRDRPGMFALILPALGLLSQLATTLGLSGDPTAPGALSYIFMILILAVAIWYLIDLGILKGTTGPNPYGPDPLAVR
jgi:uncharacterized membrane protein YhaH (DUF805 family)